LQRNRENSTPSAKKSHAGGETPARGPRARGGGHTGNASNTSRARLVARAGGKVSECGDESGESNGGGLPETDHRGRGIALLLLLRPSGGGGGGGGRCEERRVGWSRGS
jgi:hypothetical protein